MRIKINDIKTNPDIDLAEAATIIGGMVRLIQPKPLYGPWVPIWRPQKTGYQIDLTIGTPPIA